MKIPAIPVRGEVELGSWNVGTGFLADIGGRIYVATAAHVPPGRLTGADWTLWPTSLTVGLPEDETAIALFDAAGRPKFAYYEMDGQLQDVMLLPVEGAHGARLSETFHVHRIDESGTPVVGAIAHVHGYLHFLPPVPPELRTASGPIIEVVAGTMLRCRYLTSRGMSGGPVVDEAGGLVGLHIGHTPDLEDPAIVVTTAILNELAQFAPV